MKKRKQVLFNTVRTMRTRLDGLYEKDDSHYNMYTRIYIIRTHIICNNLYKVAFVYRYKLYTRLLFFLSLNICRFL